MCCKKVLKWWNEPNKEWFKIIKLVLSILKAMLFIAFLLVSFICQVIEFKYNKNKRYLSELCLYLEIIYNWRFILTILFGILFIIFKILHFLNFDFRSYLKLRKYLLKIIKALNWSQLDWPCFLRLKYYLYVFDIIHYLVYFISVIVVGSIEISLLNLNKPPIIIFYFNSVIFFFHIIVELYRIIQSQRVQTTIRDIFASDFKFSSRGVALISENELGSLECPNYFKCLIADSQHRAFSHPKEIFKIKFKPCNLNEKGINIMIGFHQTTIQAARSILTTSFKPSSSGMIGPGIYFANNYDITDHKRNQNTEGGAIFCAMIDMGKVLEIHSKYTSNDDVSKYFNSKYLHHQSGDKLDEFVIYNEKQIIEYTIIVEKKAIENFRRNIKKPYCNCIKFI
jgi:hypothetical protein